MVGCQGTRAAEGCNWGKTEREVPLKLQELKRFPTWCQGPTQRNNVVYYVNMRHHTSVDNEPLHPLGMTCPRGSGIPYFGVNLKLKVPAVSFGYDNDSQRNVNL